MVAPGGACSIFGNGAVRRNLRSWSGGPGWPISRTGRAATAALTASDTRKPTAAPIAIMPSGPDEGEPSGFWIMPGIELEFDPFRISQGGQPAGPQPY